MLVQYLIALSLLTGTPHQRQEHGKVIVEVSAADSAIATAFKGYAKTAEKALRSYFGTALSRDLTVVVCSSRADFDEALEKQWGMEKTAPWMVGAAGAEKAYFLSPRVWKTEAAEHDPDDAKAIERLVCHELVHSYHSQVNASKDLEGLDDMAWFIEGLATLVSGQLDAEHKGKAEAAAKTDGFPKRLDAVWRGKSRYALAGTLVRYVEKRFGRRIVLELLESRSNAEALAKLSLLEESLVSDWKSWLLKEQTHDE